MTISFISDKIKCPKCNSKMELIGVTDRKMWKYYCNDCHTMVESEEKRLK